MAEPPPSGVTLPSKDGRAQMERAVGDVAAVAGHLVRLGYVLLGWVPVAAGPALVLYGTYLLSPAACYILAGLAISVLTFARANPKRGRRR